MVDEQVLRLLRIAATEDCSRSDPIMVHNVMLTEMIAEILDSRKDAALGAFVRERIGEWRIGALRGTEICNALRDFIAEQEKQG